MKIRTIAFIILCFSNHHAKTQNLKMVILDSCYHWAEINYPKYKNLHWLQQQTQLDLKNLGNRVLPQISISGQATYQSEVTEIPISLPNLTIDPLSKDQYRIATEISQPITDIFLQSNRRKTTQIIGNIEAEKIQTELYRLKERITQIYFNIILLKAQLKNIGVSRNLLENRITLFNSQLKQGAAQTNQNDELQIAIVQFDKKEIETLNQLSVLIKLMHQMTQKPIDENTIFVIDSIDTSHSNKRLPELRLLDHQNELLQAQKATLKASLLPNISAFLQVGYGRPTLNMLSNEFGDYYIGGLRINWNIQPWYNYKNDNKKNQTQLNILNNQIKQFEYQNSLTNTETKANIQKTKNLIIKDDQIIKTREKLLKNADTNLKNGTINNFQYLEAFNALEEAKNIKTINEIQLSLLETQLKLNN